jgi:hypothetical protein
MAAALGTWSALSVTKPLRIEGHTSNVEGPIYYKQFIKGTIAETTEAGDTYIIPHKFDKVEFIAGMPLTAIAAANALNGGEAAAADDGAFYADSAVITTPIAFTTAASAGATTCVLVTATGSAVNDNYNGCWLVIRYPSGNKQEVKITDYVHSGTVATLADGLAEDIVATTTTYQIKGTLMTISGVCVTPTLAFEVTGTFN